jgi:hypothetical protein
MLSFTLDTYRSLLSKVIEAGFEFAPFESRNKPGKIFLLRHDIDADLGAAVQMSEVEKSLNVQATYFLMLRSPVYNLLGRENTRLVYKLIENGHHIGLHYDEGFCRNKIYELNELVRQEAEVMKLMFDIDIKAVSFHQPGLTIINNDIKLQSFVNTYDKVDMAGFFYLSDSNMAFKVNPFDLLQSNEHKRIQLLVHPMWWIGEGTENTEGLWETALRSNFQRCQEQLLATERAYGTKRIIGFTRDQTPPTDHSKKSDTTTQNS